jgi:arginyl-tRNA synthetase
MAINDLAVNRLTDQLYEMSVKIGEFYNTEECKVINTEHEASRVLLLDAVRKVMKVCFDLLGMKTLEKI